MKMKTIEIVGENYFGNWNKTRTACRGIVIDGKRILLSYETKTNQWMIPGGMRMRSPELQEKTFDSVMTRPFPEEK